MNYVNPDRLIRYEVLDLDVETIMVGHPDGTIVVEQEMEAQIAVIDMIAEAMEQGGIAAVRELMDWRDLQRQTQLDNDLEELTLELEDLNARLGCLVG